MEKNTAKQSQQTSQARPCPQDCGKCNPWQQVYCCSKMMFEFSRNFQSMKDEIGQLHEEIVELRKNIPAQSEDFIDPEIAQ